MPLVAVVNQNSKQNTESRIAQTLQQIGIQYNLLRTPNLSMKSKLIKL